MSVGQVDTVSTAMQISVVKKVMDQALQMSKQLIESGMPQRQSLPSAVGIGQVIDITA